MYFNAIATGLLLAGAAVAAPNSDYRGGHHSQFSPKGHYIDLWDSNEYRGHHFRHEVGFNKCSVFEFTEIKRDHVRSFKSPPGVTCTFYLDIKCSKRFGTDVEIQAIASEHVPHAYQCSTPKGF